MKVLSGLFLFVILVMPANSFAADPDHPQGVEFRATASDDDTHSRAEVSVNVPAEGGTVEVDMRVGDAHIRADIPRPQYEQWWKRALKAGGNAIRTPKGNMVAYYGTYGVGAVFVTWASLRYGKDYPVVPIALMFALNKLDEVLKSFGVNGTISLQASLARKGFHAPQDWLAYYGSEERFKRIWEAMKGTIEGDEQEIVDRLALLNTTFILSLTDVRNRLNEGKPEIAASSLAILLRYVMLSTFPYVFEPRVEQEVRALLDPVAYKFFSQAEDQIEKIGRENFLAMVHRELFDSEIPPQASEAMERILKRWISKKNCLDTLTLTSDSIRIPTIPSTKAATN